MPPKTNKPASGTAAATEQVAPVAAVEQVAAIVQTEDKAAIEVLAAVTAADPLTTGEVTSTDNAVSEFTHAIKAAPEKGFYRGGKFWSREETKVNQADFSDEQWAALESEPMLTIVTL